jgi:hypothetical protein
MIYRFVIDEGMETVPPTIPPDNIRPLWSISLAGERTDFGSLSQGLYDELATHFMLHRGSRSRPCHSEQLHRLIPKMEFDRQKISTYAVGFQKAFIQHGNLPVSRLSFAWGDRQVYSPDSWPLGSFVHVQHRAGYKG